MTRKAFIIYAIVVSTLELLALLVVLLIVLPALGMDVPPMIVLALTAVLVMISLVLTRLNLKAIALRPARWPDIGVHASVVKVLDPRGYVRVGNELWPAVCESCVVRSGTRVTVIRMDGLRLVVEPVGDEP